MGDHIRSTVARNGQMVIKIISSWILYFFFLFLFYFRDGHSRMKNTYLGGGGRAFNSSPGIFPSLEGHVNFSGFLFRFRRNFVHAKLSSTKIYSCAATVTLFDTEARLNMSI